MLARIFSSIPIWSVGSHRLYSCRHAHSAGDANYFTCILRTPKHNTSESHSVELEARWRTVSKTQEMQRNKLNVCVHFTYWPIVFDSNNLPMQTIALYGKLKRVPERVRDRRRWRRAPNHEQMETKANRKMVHEEFDTSKSSAVFKMEQEKI